MPRTTAKRQRWSNANSTSRAVSEMRELTPVFQELFKRMRQPVTMANISIEIYHSSVIRISSLGVFSSALFKSPE